jgi:putative membrane protein
MKNRWLLSTACGFGLLTASATAALAQNVPGENATAPSGTGAATQTITLKPGQEAGTNTVLPADTGGNPNASTQDAHFVMQASAGGMAEIMMGQLAMQRGQTQSERAYGQMLVTDHTKADDQLSPIAQTLMLKAAPGPNAMQQAMYQQLQNAPSGQFDSMFNHAMIRAHEHTIALFKREASSGQSPQLKQFAAMTLPVLYHHLHVAEALSPMPMRSAGMSSMNAMPAMSGNQGAVTGPVSGNPDNSADQLNARELSTGNPG